MQSKAENFVFQGLMNNDNKSKITSFISVEFDLFRVCSSELLSLYQWGRGRGY